MAEADGLEGIGMGGIEAIVEDQVRRRLTDRLSSGGVGTEGVAREVLYWLPQQFVEAYRMLMLRALSLGDGVPGAEFGGAGVDEGRILAEGATPSRYRGTEQGLGMGSGGGKRWRNTGWVVKDERALALKQGIDARLMEIAGILSIGSVASGNGSHGGNPPVSDRSHGEEPGGKPWINRGGSLESHGNQGGEVMELIRADGTKIGEFQGTDVVVGRGVVGKEDESSWKVGMIEQREIGTRKRIQNRCRDCGRVMNNDWTRCPYHNV